MRRPFKRIVALYPFFLLVLFPCPSHAETTLAANGLTNYKIVLGPHASPAVKHAATELADDLRQMTGATFDVVLTPPDKGPAIYVGTADSGDNVETKLPESVDIETPGPNLILCGADDRGVEYAVDEFLERYLGERWYAPGVTLLPSHRTLKIPDIKLTESPAFSYRDTDEYPAEQDAEWDVHLRLNGESVPDKPELGGHSTAFNCAENFYGLVPPEKYFATHPEYYSLINGKRSDDPRSQLCLTNPDVLKIVTQAMVDEAKARPDLSVLGLSPNDARAGNCQDANCLASDAKYGAPSGTLLNFVNQVAAGVQAAMPERKVSIEMLAYLYTIKPPTPGTIQAADNVIVCYAPLTACVAHPLATDPTNAENEQDLDGWSRIAKGRFHAWHYVTNFANYLQPFPDWDELGPDIIDYENHGVSGVFCEGNYESPGEMSTLRTYVIAHLLWNPKQEVWPLIADYCRGYYGPAGGVYIVRYLKLMEVAVDGPGVHMGIYDDPTAVYLSPSVLDQADTLFEQALVSTTDKDQRERIEEARLGVTYTQFMQALSKPRSPSEDAILKVRYQALLTDLGRFHIDWIGEGYSVANWMKDVQWNNSQPP